MWGEDKPYEPPENPDLTIDNDILSIEEGRTTLREFILKNVVAVSPVRA